LARRLADDYEKEIFPRIIVAALEGPWIVPTDAQSKVIAYSHQIPSEMEEFHGFLKVRRFESVK
jgi:hypothetical protein